MKNIILHILFLLVISLEFYAQTKEDNLDFNQYNSSVFNSKEQALSLVSSMNKKNSVTNNIQQSSGVLIQQIGDFNRVAATLRAKETKVSIEQNGNGNDLFLNKSSITTITQNIVQQGDNNIIADYVLKTKFSIDTEMIQNGNNNSIFNLGTNSLSQNMKITQTGNGASIILINQ